MKGRRQKAMRAMMRGMVIATAAVILVIAGLQLMALGGKAEPPYYYFKIFTETLYLVVNKYVEEPDIELMHKGALVGIAKEYGHDASLLGPAEKAFLESGGEPGRIGLTLHDAGSFFVVIGVRPDGPAAAAGIVRGDRLYAVDGTPALTTTIVEAERKLRGKPGTFARLAIVHHKNSKPEYVKVTRRILEPVYFTTQYDDTTRTGIITVDTLDATAVQLITDQLRLWHVTGLTNLVMDLRYCTTGDYAQAVTLADAFLDSGKTGAFRGDNELLMAPHEFSPATTIYRGKIGIVFDGSTRHACELFARLLAVSDAAYTVGRDSFGELAWYDIVESKGRYALYLPVAIYQPPKTDDSGAKVSPDNYYPPGKDKPVKSGYIEGNEVIDYLLKIMAHADQRRVA